LTRFVVVLKPAQDVVTSIFFMTFILLVAAAGVMTVVFLPQSGLIQSDVALTRIYTDNLDAPSASMPAQETNRFIDCEVIYQQASLDSESAVNTSEPGQDAMAALYYAVYTCTTTPLERVHARRMC
jgi:hypothetical protein